MKITKSNLGWSCKMSLLAQLKETKYINESYLANDFKDWIKGMTNEQAIILTFNGKYIKKQQLAEMEYHKKEALIEGALQTALKIGLAVLVGGAVGAVGGAAGGVAGVAVGGAAGARLGRGNPAAIMAGMAVGGVAGAAVGMTPGILASLLIMQMFKSNLAKCMQRCKGDHQCIENCKRAASGTVARYVRSEIPKCNKTKNPQKCNTKLQSLNAKWTKKSNGSK
jgi:hypothetical protein